MTAIGLESLVTNVRGEVLMPGEPGYDDTRRLWNGMIDKKPAVIVRCLGVVDVIEAVDFGRDAGLDIAIRGGGHNVAGNAVCDDGLMIDLSLMRAVQVDPGQQTAWVQGGCKLGDVDRETQLHGLVAPAGVVSHTGVAGLTLGGGTGWLSGKYGLTVDHLLEVEIVTADGKAVRASKEQNSDLFWALTGGGGNFGVATAFKFKLYPLGPELMRAAVLYSAKDADTILQKWQALVPDFPDELTTLAILWCIPDEEIFPEEIRGEPVLAIHGVYSDSIDAGIDVVQPLRELGTPLLDMSGPVLYTEMQQQFDPFVPMYDYQYYWKSLELDTLSDEVIDQIVSNAESRPPRSLIVIQAMKGAYARVAADATAYGDRSIPYLLEINAVWENPAENEKNIAWVRGFWELMKNYSSTGGVYLNHPGFGEEGEELVKASYGDNYERLVTIKNKYDPENLFHMNQNIKPTV